MGYIAEAAGNYDKNQKQAGDSTRDNREVRVCEYRDISNGKDLFRVYRYPFKKSRNTLMRAMIAICNNKNFGYHQGYLPIIGRQTGYNAAKKAGWTVSGIKNISKKVNTDCSGAITIAVNVMLKAAGKTPSLGLKQSCSTLGYKSLSNVGFKCIYSKHKIWKESDLMPGDIIIAINGNSWSKDPAKPHRHVALYLGDNPKGEFYK